MGTIQQIAAHLGVVGEDSLGAAAVEAIDSFAKFANYRLKSTMNQPSCAPNWVEGKGEFVRKGEVGDWANFFSPDLTREYHAWIREEGYI